MIRAIQEDNNNAVEHMLLGHPKDAVATLLQALDTWKRYLGSPAFVSCASASLSSAASSSTSLTRTEEEGCAKQLYSVELDSEVETVDHAFPFRWYGRPIAIASDIDGTEDATLPFDALSLDLNAVVLLYNLGIAYQLEATRRKEDGEFVLGRLSSTAAFESYTLALRALVTFQEKTRRPCHGNEATLCERVNFGLLHVAIVNNLLFLYAQSADLEGMTTCLTVLRKILSAVCTGLPESCAEDFAMFHHNAILFPTPGSLSLAPAA